MLKMKYLFENFDLARLALGSYPHDTDSLDKALSWYRISANAVYPFFQNGRICFLRMAPADERTAEGIRAELEFINYLRANGYPAMEPLKANDGRELLTLDTQWGVWHVCAFAGVGGKQFEDIELNDEAIYDYGAALGWLHSLSRAYAPENRRAGYSDLLKWAVDELNACDAPHYMLDEACEVEAELAALPRDAQVYGLVHYDFEPDNVFYIPDKRVCPVIDFDDCIYHWYALDIEQVFDSLGELYEDESALDGAKARFMLGYRSRSAFTEDMERSMPLMRRFINVYSYARLKHCLCDATEQRPDWLVELEAKLGARASRIEQSVKG